MKCSARDAWSIHSRMGIEHTLSPRVGCLARYVQIGTEEELGAGCFGRIPSQKSYVRLLDAFEAVFRTVEACMKHACITSETLGGHFTRFDLSDMTPNKDIKQFLKISIARSC